MAGCKGVLQGSGRVQLVGVGLLSPGAVTAAMVVYDFCGDLGPLCGSVAVLETGTDCVGWLVYWLAGRLADWLVGWLDHLGAHGSGWTASREGFAGTHCRRTLSFFDVGLMGCWGCFVSHHVVLQ